MSSPPPASDDQPTQGRYEIRLQGHLDARWTTWFDGLRLSHEGDGTTVLHGRVVDQAALHGLLRKVRDLGLPLISVRRVEPDHPEAPTPNRSPLIHERKPT